MDVKGLTRTFGIRPKDAADRRMYNPERDIAYCGPVLMKLTMTSFYEGGQAHEIFKQLSEEEQQQFGDMLQSLSDFCKDYLRGDRTFTVALKDSTFGTFPQKLQDLYLSHLGHTLISAFYYGVRDVMTKGHNEHAMPYDEIFDSAEELRANLRGKEESHA